MRWATLFCLLHAAVRFELRLALAGAALPASPGWLVLLLGGQVGGLAGGRLCVMYIVFVLVYEAATVIGGQCEGQQAYSRVAQLGCCRGAFRNAARREVTCCGKPGVRSGSISCYWCTHYYGKCLHTHPTGQSTTITVTPLSFSASCAT